MRESNSVMRSQHKDTTLRSSPEIVRGPWTQDARQRALDQEIEAHYLVYFNRAMKSRNWSPWNDLPFDEIAQLGPRLSQETIQLIEGFLGIEEYVGDYVLEGLALFRHNRIRRNFQLQWGAEEARHGVTWELVLKHSHARTDRQLQEYLETVRNSRWQAHQHPGLDSLMGSAAYAMVQERATYFLYQEMRLRIREEYGLPPLRTLAEQRRGYETGAAAAFWVVAQDEIAHHGLFLHLVRSYMKYFPSLTFEVLTQVFQGFEMPALRLIPNARAFFRAGRQNKLFSRERYVEKVHNPILNSLGLEGNEAFERAVLLARRLPKDLGPDDVKLSRTGEWVIG